MNQQENFDFKQVDASPAGEYLQPGYYTASIVKGTFNNNEGTNAKGEPKKPFINVEFVSENGGKFNNKFYISPATLPNLAYFHSQWWGKPLEKEFKSAQEVGAYFEKLCNAGQTINIKRRVELSGQQSADGKVYASLGWKNFVISDDADFFEEGAFAVGSAHYKRVVKLTTAVTNPSHSSDDTMLPNSSSDSNKEEFSDLPF